MDHAKHILEESGIAPTPNRQLVLAAIVEAGAPMSLIELETQLGSIDKSAVHRVLTVLEEHGLIHAIQDGRGVTRYEMCHGHGHGCSVEGMHAHFYCEVCGRVTCLPDIHTPHIELPEGYRARTVNFMLKGTCPDCTRKS